MLRLILLLSLWLPILVVPVEEDWEFPDDDLETRLDQVSEGELTLLEAPPDEPVHYHHNRIRITPDSLQDGWVILDQCHYNLDPVAESQIVYHSERIRNLRLLNAEHITEVRIEGPTVQLKGIGTKAQLCLQVESLAFLKLADDRYRLRTGPYMRRFLDGYYPMRVSLEVYFPADRLELQELWPLPGKAGKLERGKGFLLWDGWFTGRLITAFDFVTDRQP